MPMFRYITQSERTSLKLWRAWLLTWRITTMDCSNSLSPFSTEYKMIVTHCRMSDLRLRFSRRLTPNTSTEKPWTGYQILLRVIARSLSGKFAIFSCRYSIPIWLQCSILVDTRSDDSSSLGAHCFWGNQPICRHHHDRSSLMFYYRVVTGTFRAFSDSLDASTRMGPVWNWRNNCCCFLFSSSNVSPVFRHKCSHTLLGVTKNKPSEQYLAIFELLPSALALASRRSKISSEDLPVRTVDIYRGKNFSHE